MGVYRDLGVSPVINVLGTVTMVGGSRMDPRVLDAMSEAAGSFVNMRELHRNAGRTIAQLVSAEAACVTSGAAAGLAIAAAACMAHADPAKILQLPDTTGMPNEALVLKAHRILYDQAIRLAGAEFVEVGVTSFASLEQVEASITNRTALFLYAAEASSMRGSLPLRDLAVLLRHHGIPLVVDAAAELPPVSNLSAFLSDGADLVVFSGGKEIGGPQSSGLILGATQLIEDCNANCFPNYSIGRAMKTDKETIVGLVKAVELFVQRDYDAIFDRWEKIVDAVVSAVNGLPGCTARKGHPTEQGIQPKEIPRAYITADNLSGAELLDRLLRGEPSVVAGMEDSEIALNPQCMTETEVQPLIDALITALS